MDGRHGRVVGTAVALAVMGLAAACGSEDYGTKASGQTPSPQASQPVGTMVTVSESEFHLSLSTTTFHPGTYTFVARNTGHATHALTIDGPGVSRQSSTSIDRGETTSLTVTLQAGQYRLFCPVGNHADQGMDTMVTVA